MDEVTHGWRMKDGVLIHDGDCRFWSFGICTCGLLHTLRPRSDVDELRPAFGEDDAEEHGAFELLMALDRDRRTQSVTPHLEMCCNTCQREIDPNWIRQLWSIIQSAIDGAFRNTQHDHPTELPKNWRPSFTKRAVGQIVNRIWEMERGLCSLKEGLNGKLTKQAPGSTPEPPNSETEPLASTAQTENGGGVPRRDG